ncbi:hypothetical protein QZH56_11580 [Streptomyces olivoreticuli]|uniref:hypothetical protein n=1 Tax=Streptomyces olivoreticuli TaxID=68246 RepID=UPI00265A8B55|nr:hypothetical protein [Streptomyces olivoreticuli]WKK26171.1 hypothetical protein QZH56_11580 [Streptomyces olivoreticuli]
MSPMSSDAQQFQEWQEFQQWKQLQQQHSSGDLPHEKENVILTASTVRGSLIGMAQAQMSANLTNADGTGIKAQPISFVVTSTNQEFGRATTDSNGDANLDSGANISDPQLMASAAFSGYTAVYHGNATYNPAKARGKYIVGLG